jgi:transposase
VSKDIQKCIAEEIHSNPFIKIEELASIISSTCNLKRSRRTVNRYIQSQGLSFKSAFRMVDVLHPNDKVKQFCKSYIQSCDDESLISIDETGFYLGDHRKKGWACKGKRLAIKGDKNLRRIKFTLILAISCKGLVGYEILDHNCRKVDFLKFVQNLNIPKKSTIIMDNIPFHHSKEVVNALTVKDVSLLYAIPYSPKINPIENVFGMIKPLFREHCPPQFNADFDYYTLFENILIFKLQDPLDKFFTHVKRIAVSTLDSIESDPSGFQFNGYDL